MLKPGDIVDGKYKILNQIGRGGMSVVYMAINERANKTWAIKEVRRDGVLDYEVVRQGLSIETDLMKRLRHPNLPSIVDVIEDRDSFLIVMDYIEGRTLSTILKEQGRQEQGRVIRWARQLCDVLGYLHSRHPAIIYRDMKPGNIMLKPDGNLMLIDFGIAREFKENRKEDTSCLGTRGYAAPEQYGGLGQTDPRTDIYCLGATLYHLLTGHNPGEAPYEMIPVRQWDPSFSAGLETIILKCTQANPQDRFQSCEELRYALDHYQELNVEYEKKQKKQLCFFGLSLFLGILFLSGAFGFRFAGWNLKSHSVDQYLIEARSSATEEERFASYFQAVSVDPGAGEIYGEILEDFLKDGEFSEAEQKKIRFLLGSRDKSGRSFQMILRGRQDAYRRFCYQAAMAWFYYTGDPPGDAALLWLKELQTCSGLSEKEKMRVDVLYQIASYDQKRNLVNLTGDPQVSYRDYWEDLKQSASWDLVAEDNVQTALIVYRNLISVVSSSCMRFRDAGVKEEQIRNVLDEITKLLKGEITDAVEAAGEMEIRDKWRQEKEALLQELAVIDTDLLPSVYSRTGDLQADEQTGGNRGEMLWK